MKSLDLFHRNRDGKHGRRSVCKDCCAAYAREWYAENGEQHKVRNQWWQAMNPDVKARNDRRYRASKYGLTLEQYDAALARGCAICGAHAKRMVMDHCHESGLARDALCGNCNQGLGQFGDDPDRLEAASRYLRRHSVRVDSALGSPAEPCPR